MPPPDCFPCLRHLSDSNGPLLGEHSASTENIELRPPAPLPQTGRQPFFTSIQSSLLAAPLSQRIIDKEETFTVSNEERTFIHQTAQKEVEGAEAHPPLPVQLYHRLQESNLGKKWEHISHHHARKASLAKWLTSPLWTSACLAVGVLYSAKEIIKFSVLLTIGVAKLAKALVWDLPQITYQEHLLTQYGVGPEEWAHLLREPTSTPSHQPHPPTPLPGTQPHELSRTRNKELARIAQVTTSTTLGRQVESTQSSLQWNNMGTHTTLGQSVASANSIINLFHYLPSFLTGINQRRSAWHHLKHLTNQRAQATRVETTPHDSTLHILDQKESRENPLALQEALAPAYEQRSQEGKRRVRRVAFAVSGHGTNLTVAGRRLGETTGIAGQTSSAWNVTGTSGGGGVFIYDSWRALRDLNQAQKIEKRSDQLKALIEGNQRGKEKLEQEGEASYQTACRDSFSLHAQAATAQQAWQASKLALKVQKAHGSKQLRLLAQYHQQVARYYTQKAKTIDLLPSSVEKTSSKTQETSQKAEKHYQKALHFEQLFQASQKLNLADYLDKKSRHSKAQSLRETWHQKQQQALQALTDETFETTFSKRGSQRLHIRPQDHSFVTDDLDLHPRKSENLAITKSTVQQAKKNHQQKWKHFRENNHLILPPSCLRHAELMLTINQQKKRFHANSFGIHLGKGGTGATMIATNIARLAGAQASGVLAANLVGGYAALPLSIWYAGQLMYLEKQFLNRETQAADYKIALTALHENTSPLPLFPLDSSNPHPFASQDSTFQDPSYQKIRRNALQTLTQSTDPNALQRQQLLAAALSPTIESLNKFLPTLQDLFDSFKIDFFQKLGFQGDSSLCLAQWQNNYHPTDEGTFTPGRDFWPKNQSPTLQDLFIETLIQEIVETYACTQLEKLDPHISNICVLRSFHQEQIAQSATLSKKETPTTLPVADYLTFIGFSREHDLTSPWTREKSPLECLITAYEHDRLDFVQEQMEATLGTQPIH